MKANDASRSDLASILARIRQKREHDRVSLSTDQNILLMTFLDIVQEFPGLQDFFRVCVSVPLDFMGVESRLYLLDEADSSLRLRCDSRKGSVVDRRALPAHIHLAEDAYETGDSYVLPIKRRPSEVNEVSVPQSNPFLMGMFEITPLARLSEDDKRFFNKYINRIGYILHNRIIANQNIRHLKFIHHLVTDIEHNVIVPNMHFKHLFNQLKVRLQEIEDLEKLVSSVRDSHVIGDENCELVINRVVKLHKALAENHRELLRHHANYSLSLESLFRRDHFEQGHFVLVPQLCLVEKEIIEPQLAHFASRLQSRAIAVQRPADMVGEEIPLLVDVGLLAQVYANLFSNAVKYTEENIGNDGRPYKYMAYGREFLRNCFGPGKDGIKFNVFTTGPHLSDSDAVLVFADGYRGKNSKDIFGQGHGLSFIKHVIEIHSGRVGYEPTPGGNNFYFILPLPPSQKV